jgi:Ca2+-binding EF-hand superfamily protein
MLCQEYRMTSSFKMKEIARLRTVFLEATNGSEEMDKDTFLNIQCISVNPLKERLAFCFGYDDTQLTLDFTAFLEGVSSFNSIGRVNQKLKLAFKIQDYDGDMKISRMDLQKYIEVITANSLSDEDVLSLVSNVMKETSSDQNLQFISLPDFQRVVIKTDFQSKLQLGF